MKKFCIISLLIGSLFSCSQKIDKTQKILQGNYHCDQIHLKENADPILGWLGFVFKDDPIISFSADSIYWNDTLIGYHNGKDHIYIYDKEDDTYLSALFYLTNDSLIIEDEDLRLSFYKLK